jgi:hypothetical protein
LATTGRGDHKVLKGHVVALGGGGEKKEIFLCFLMLREEIKLRMLKIIWTQGCAANILIISS